MVEHQNRNIGELDAVLRSLQVGVLHAINRKVMWGNQRYFDMLGYARDELIGQDTVVYFLNKSDYVMIGEAGYQSLVAGKPFNTELPLKRKDGEIVWCHITGNAVDLQDLSQGFIWSFADITAMKTAEATARKTQEEFEKTLAEREAILRSLQVGVLLAKERKVIWGNQRYFDMLGYEQSELLGQCTEVYFAETDDYLTIGRDGYPLLIQGKRYATEMLLRRKDGSTLWCHITGNAVDLNDLSKGFIWSFADITDRKRAEQEVRDTLDDLRNAQAQLVEAEKMAALGGLVAGVAHEINTPIGIGLTVVTHFQNKTNELFGLFDSQKMKKADLERYLDVAKQTSTQLVFNITRASDLIQSFKRVAVDQTSDDRRTFDLKTYLGEILTSLTPTLRKGGHQVAIDCADGIEINSFPGAFSQIISNLVMNALIHAFKPDQPGHISIVVHPKSAVLEIQFTDDGCGIPENNLTKIFDPFFTTKRGSGGSGLGLNIVYNLVTQKLQGRISCTSQIDKGTTFRMVIPRNAANAL